MKEVKVYERPKTWMPEVHTHYCPGCGHGIAHRLVCEIIDELNIQKDTIGVAPVGCAAMMYDYIDTDFCEAGHGRAPAVATGLKRVRPDKVVFTYQGDGDLASIGTAEIIHAANRGENITVVLGQRATTCPLGRDPKVSGYPIRVCELLSSLATPGYIERVTVAQPKYIIRAKQALKKAFQYQIDKKGFSFVEILSSCPTNWGMRPVEAFEWTVNSMMPYYPLGLFKDYE